MKYGDDRKPIERVTQAQSILRVVEELLYNSTSAGSDFADEIRFALIGARTLLEDVGDSMMVDAREEKVTQ